MSWSSGATGESRPSSHLTALPPDRLFIDEAFSALLEGQLELAKKQKKIFWQIFYPQFQEFWFQVC